MPVTTVADESAMQTELQKAVGKLVIVDFTATWCGPCQQMAPYFQDLSTKYPSSVFLKVDVDENPDVAMEYEVTSMPTFLFLKEQQEIDRLTGADPSGLETRIHTLASSSHHPSNCPPETEDYYKTSPIVPKRSRPQALLQQVQPQIQPQLSPSNPPLNLPIPEIGASGQMPTSKLGRSLPPAMQNPTSPTQPQQSLNRQQILANWQVQNNMPMHHPSLISQGILSQGFPPGFNLSQLSPAEVAALSNQINSVSQLAGLLNISQQQSQNQYSTTPLSGIQEEAFLRLANRLQENLNENDQINGKSQEEFVVRRERSRERGEVKAHRRKSTHRTKSNNKDRGQQSGYASRATKERESHAQKLVKIKKRQPVSTVQIRLADGTKLSGQFNINHPVSKIREFINNARPEVSSRPFSLSTVFPSREITNEEQTIQEAKLHNSVVVQRWFS